MNKKFIILFTFLLTIILILAWCYTINGSTSLKGSYIPFYFTAEKTDEYKLDKNITIDDILKINNGKKISLTYKSSFMDIDEYTSDINNSPLTVSFRNGKFFSIEYDILSEKDNSKLAISSDDAEKIALEFTKNRISDFEQNYKLDRKDFYEDTKEFLLMYTKNSGDFRIADSVLFRISGTGKICYYSENNIGRFDNINLSNTDTEEIKNTVISELKKKNVDKEIKNIKITSMTINTYNNQDVIMINYTIEFEKLGFIADTYMYVLN